jgi:predicted nucleotidyltransferase
MTTDIPEHITAYVRELAARHQGIREIWLFGSHANNTATESSDWDLLVIGDQDILESLSKDYREPDYVDLLVVYDGNKFKGPKDIYNNGAVKHGSMIAWEWHQVGPEEAEYRATKFIEGSDSQISVKKLRAIRLYPMQVINDA